MLNCWTKFKQTACFQFKTEYVNTTTEFCIWNEKNLTTKEKKKEKEKKRKSEHHHSILHIQILNWSKKEISA